MFSVRWDSGVLRSLGQALTAVLVAATFVLLPTSTPEAQASGVLADGSNSVVDYALDIDGSVVSVSSAVIPEGSNDPFTVEFWFRAASTGSNILLSQGDWTDTYYVKQGGGSLVVHHNGLELNTGYKLQPNAWTHFAHTVDPSDSSSGSKVYVDGGLITESSGVRLGYPTVGGDHGLHVGSLSRSGLEQFDGLIDQVKIWSGVLDSSEIALSMHALGTPTGAGGLIAHYDFNEGSGTNVNDRIGTADLTINQSGSFLDVKQTTSVAGGDTVIAFPRTYLPGVGGWQVPEGVTQARVLIVGGGGGGGAWIGGGGGAGGFREETGFSIDARTTYSVQVGQGGVGASFKANGPDINAPVNWATRSPTSGQQSVFGSLNVAGGGAGGNFLRHLTLEIGSGGSGGGGTTYLDGAPAAIGASPADPAFGNRGGDGAGTGSAISIATGLPHPTGGGGGAGGAGERAQADDRSGKGGPGAISTILTSALATSLGVGEFDSGNVYFAGGGGGSLHGTGNTASYVAATGGLGGGGDGTVINSSYPTLIQAGSGMPNTGGGGGGAANVNSQTSIGGSGGSGVVVVRYTPNQDLAWNTPTTSEGSYAFRYSTSDPIIPTSATRNWTFEAWVKPQTRAGWMPIVAQQADQDSHTSGLRNAIWLLGSQVVLVTPATDNYTGVNLESGQWTHIAWVLSNGTYSELHINGTLAWSGHITRTAASGTYFTIAGSRQNTADGEYEGQIDQVKIWGTQLTSAQVISSMHAYSTSANSPAASCDTGLRAHFDFNDSHGGPLLDKSGCGRNLAFNTAVEGDYGVEDFTDSAIVETGNASTQNIYFKFNRSYLTAVGGWTPPAGVTNFDGAAAAGGGGGASRHGGGGGAGELVLFENANLGSGPIPIIVGQGGKGVSTSPATSPATNGSKGQDTLLGMLVLSGGGFGPVESGKGGSGAGGQHSNDPGGASSVSANFGPYQFLGNNGGASTASGAWAGGGGGGAVSSGFSADTTGGTGGHGRTISLTGTPLCLAAGGGGGSDGAISAGLGGGCPDSGLTSGGEGSSGYSTSLTATASAIPNSGSGGGGGGHMGNGNSPSGNGGSGVVILAYSLAPDAPTSLTATQSTSHATVNLSWNAPSYTGNSSITDYDIEYKPAGGSWTSYSDGVSTLTTAAVQLPQQCIAHEFRVIAKNTNFSSVASATASATPVWGTFGSLTGVQISSTNSECVVKFTSTTATTWTPPSGTTTLEALLVGGGGGGGAWVGGGGGGGGVTESVVALTPNTAVNVDVGAGGYGASKIGGDSVTVAGIGEPTVFGSTTAFGGGAGMSWDAATPTGNFATSGGATGRAEQRVALTPTETGQGFKGGDVPGDNNTSTAQPHPAGGGGGAGGAGENADLANNVSGDGGVGFASDITGTTIRYGGGGGGGVHGSSSTYQNGDFGVGGAGGGGAGSGPNRIDWSEADTLQAPVGQAGQDGLGGGGGGAGHPALAGWSSRGGDGGSGLVVIRQLSVGAPAISTQPQDASAEPGQTKTLTVTATGNGTLSYQWQSSTNSGTSWSDVGSNASSFTTGTLALSDNGIQYRVIVTNTLNGQNSVVTSSVAVISVVGVTIGSGLCETMVSNDSGATVSQTAAGGCLLEFTTPGNNSWFVPNNVSSVEALVVGGGGGGASGRGDGYSWYGGGAGGGGGEYTKVTLGVTTSQQIPLVVGAGGTAGGASARGALPNPGVQGENSSFSVSGAVALGGSGGQGSAALGVGGPGGAGGSGTGVAGSSGGDGSDGLAWRPTERPTDGGTAMLTTLGGEQFCLGGGGGGGNRGAGAPHFYYQAQGGDCSTAGLSSGGDGNYFNGSNYVLAGEGIANTGGGGGGGSYNSGGGYAGAAGASGLVALYYVPGAGEITLSQPNAMSYSSTANTTSVTLTKTSPGSASWTTSNQTICTVTGDDSGATVTFLIAGVCAVSVTVAASGGYSTGSAEVSFRIDKITQSAPGWDSATATVAFGSSLDLYEKLASPTGIANYSFTATGTGCAVTGVMLTVGDAGTNCSVTPTINGTDIYLPATGTALTVSVTKISQSALVLTSATSMNVDQTLTLSAAGGSGTGVLTYHVVSAGNSASCVIANASTGVLVPSSAGSCEVYAKRASSTNYDEVTSSHVVITVNKISQNLSWVSQPQAQYVAGNTYALEATASSQLAVAYSISSGLCTLAGSTVTFTGSGDCVIEAGQPGDGSYLPAVTISQTVSVGKINQTMTFSALVDKSWGSLAFSLSATASSGLSIVYSENNQTTNDACDVSANGIVTIKHVGTCAITATQAGNSAYTAVSNTRLFEVTANQAGAPFIGSVSFGDRQLNASFFTPSYLGGGTVSAYELQAHPLDGGAVVKNTGCIPQQGPNQTCSVVGLTNGVTYELKVAAITQAGLGQLSASSSEVTPAANPEAVGNLVAIEGNGTLTLQWTPPTNLGGGTFDQYRIFWRAPGGSYRAVNSPNAFVATQSSTTYVITGLDNGVAYDVKVITTSTVNSAELQSNTAEVRQTPYTVPDAPAAVVALDNDNNVVVAWQAPIFDGGNPIDQYVVEKDGTAVCTITSATTTSCEVEKPSPGNTSLIEVRAGNDAGLSAPVSTSITVAALPGTNQPGIIGGGFPGVTPGAAAPIVLDVSGSATVQTNELIRLVGTNLNMVEKVLIGNIEASFFVNSAQLITIRIPVEIAAGNPTITLQGSFGTRIFSGLIQVSVTQVAVDTKVTIGTFLGYAAVYTKNHEGKRLSMKIGNKWRVIDPLAANYTYNYTKVGVGKTVTVEVYIDRVLVQVKQIKIQ